MVDARERPGTQLRWLAADVRRITCGRRWRLWTCWFDAPFWAVASYRLARASWLLLGRGHVALRVILAPALFLLRPWLGRCEIHYRADLGPGLNVLHPGLGVVISAGTVAGRNLMLTGGNTIGGRRPIRPGDIAIGDDVSLGVNAVVLGPVRIGDRVKVGACALVLSDAGDDEVLVGVPASAILSGRPD